MRIFFLTLLLFFQANHIDCSQSVWILPDPMAVVPVVAFWCANTAITSHMPASIYLPTSKVQMANISISGLFSLVNFGWENVTRMGFHQKLQFTHEGGVPNQLYFIIVSRFFLKVFEISALAIMHGLILTANGHLTSKQHWKGAGLHFCTTQILSIILLCAFKTAEYRQ
jgi:hypothetical protein